MTLVQLRAAARSPWAALAGVVLVALLVVHRLNAGREAEVALERERARAAEAEVRDAKGQVVTRQVRIDRLEAELRLLGPELQAALALARERGDRLAALVRASTGGVLAAGPARPPKGPPTEAGKEEHPPACLLAAGDLGEVRVEQVLLDTSAGNHVLVGTAAAWRLAPGPPAKLFGGELRAPVTIAYEKAPPAAAVSRWGAGPMVMGSQDGLAFGLAVAAPPLRLWRLELELVVGGGLGAGGPQGAAMLLGRL